MKFKDYYNCGFEVTMEIIGGKWKGLILWHLHKHTVMRNGELMRSIKGISQKMLTQNIREMEEHNLVIRKVYDVIPPKVEYSLTQKAKDLGDIFIAMKDWGADYAIENKVNLLCEV